MSDNRTREEIRAELDESYETAYYKERVTDKGPFTVINLIILVVVVALMSLLFQYDILGAIQLAIFITVLNCLIHAARMARWNRNIKKFGLTGYLAANGIEYGKDDK